VPPPAVGPVAMIMLKNLLRPVHSMHCLDYENRLVDGVQGRCLFIVKIIRNTLWHSAGILMVKQVMHVTAAINQSCRFPRCDEGM